jgi:D-2-hydroxyacid dehydrogenase (NADP+)
MTDVIMTPHSAGETQRYESNIIDLLQENLKRLYRGDALRNQIV